MKQKPTYQELENEIQKLRERLALSSLNEMQKLTIAVEQSSNLIVITDTNGNIEYVNSIFTTVTGYTPEEVIGKTPRILKSGTHPKEYYEELWKTIKSGKPWKGEIQNSTKNGNLFWEQTTITPITNSKGEITNFIAIKEDLTKFKEKERELKHSNNRLKALSEATNEAIFFSKKGICTDTNTAACNMFGYTYDEIIGIFGTDVIAEESKELVKNKMLSGYELPYDAIAQRKNKSTFYGEFRGKMYDYEGEQVRVTAVTDIDWRKKNEELLKEAKEKAQKSEETKNKFFSIIAHDLISPFNSMLGFSGIIVKNFDNYNSAEQKEYVEIINNGIKNTYKLLDNLLLWSRTQNESINFNPCTINPYLITVEITELLNQIITDKSLTIKNLIPKNITLNADKDMLATIIRNLMSNAIKFTNKGGEIIINAEKKDQSIEISVADSGIGIANDLQPSLFDISKGISTSGTENESGTGLGLILCKEFVEKHGGKMWLKSDEGIGSTFTFSIPR